MNNINIWNETYCLWKTISKEHYDKFLDTKSQVIEANGVNDQIPFEPYNEISLILNTPKGNQFIFSENGNVYRKARREDFGMVDGNIWVIDNDMYEDEQFIYCESDFYDFKPLSDAYENEYLFKCKEGVLNYLKENHSKILLQSDDTGNYYVFSAVEYGHSLEGYTLDCRILDDIFLFNKINNYQVLSDEIKNGIFKMVIHDTHVDIQIKSDDIDEDIKNLIYSYGVVN